MRMGHAVALSLGLAGCAPHWTRHHDERGSRPLPCAALAVPGTRDGLVAALDRPHREFPADRVAMWHLLEVGGECMSVRRSRNPRALPDHSLVVEFDGADRVVRWSLLAAR
jgi:hypothetical protein